MTRQQASLAYQSVMHVASILHAAVLKMERQANRFPSLTPKHIWEWIAHRKAQAAEHVEVAEALALEYDL